jgi:hypothetical protein
MVQTELKIGYARTCSGPRSDPLTGQEAFWVDRRAFVGLGGRWATPVFCPKERLEFQFIFFNVYIHGVY